MVAADFLTLIIAAGSLSANSANSTAPSAEAQLDKNTWMNIEEIERPLSLMEGRSQTVQSYRRFQNGVLVKTDERRSKWKILLAQDRADATWQEYTKDAHGDERLMFDYRIIRDEQFCFKRGITKLTPPLVEQRTYYADRRLAQEKAVRFLNQPQSSLFLFGRLPAGLPPIPKLLATGRNIRSRASNLDGQHVLCISCGGDYGTAELYLSERGSPVQFSLDMKSGDLWYGRTLPAPAGNDALTEISISIRWKETVSRGSAPICPAGTMQVTNTYTSGLSEQIRYASEWTSINSNPDLKAADAFVMDQVPDGTRIAVEDEPGLAYFWRDKRIQLADNSVSAKQIDRDLARTSESGTRHASMPEGAKYWSRVPVIPIGLGLAILGGGFWIRRRMVA